MTKIQINISKADKIVSNMNAGKSLGEISHLSALAFSLATALFISLPIGILFFVFYCMGILTTGCYFLERTGRYFNDFMKECQRHTMETQVMFLDYEELWKVDLIDMERINNVQPKSE